MLSPLSLVLLPGIFLPLIPWHHALAEDFLGDSNVTIQDHKIGPAKEKLLQGPTEEQEWSLLFFSDKPDPVDPRIVSYETLPACERSEVKLQEIAPSESRAEDLFNVLYYSDDDPKQVRLAAGFPHFSIPYRAALLKDESDGHPDYWQSFARFITLYCLPTRYHITWRQNHRFIERRLGDAAWDADSGKVASDK